MPPALRRAWEALAAEHRAQCEAHGIVGSRVSLWHDGAPAGDVRYGLADRAAGRPVEDDTIWHWASITKTFTGLAVLQLRDRGRLALDDPLTRYLPELRQVHNPFGPMEAVTLRQVMQHAAGFRAATWPWGGDRPWHPHEPATWTALAAMMPYTEIRFPPGSRYGYSNLAVIFLGRIIELLTGDDYEVYVDKNILKPLGMYDSYFDLTPYHLRPRRANGYLVRDGAMEAQGPDFDTGITVSNGGLNAPFADMRRYLNFLAGVPGGAHHDTVLRRASLEEMWRPAHPVAARGAFRESVGLLFHLMEGDVRGAAWRWPGHTGSQRGFISFFYVHPPTRTGCLAVYNTAGDGGPPDTRALSHVLRERLFTEVFPCFAAT